MLRVTLHRPRATLLPSLTTVYRRSVSTMATKEASPVECKEMLASGAAVAYLDVRTPEEFEAGHVKDAKNVPIMFRESGGMAPNPGFMTSVTEAMPEKDAAIVVGCKSGARSAKAVAAMASEGYSNLTNVQGGYDAWVASGL